MLFKMIKSNFKRIVSIIVICCAVIFRRELKSFFDGNAHNIIVSEGIFTESELRMYDGVQRKELYLAVLGVVFDVTKGRKHYQKGAGYNYFVGKDGSRALVTGDFQDESSNRDHVMDLSCTDLSTLIHWRETFKKKYTEAGILFGRFYNQNGEQTKYSLELNKKIEQCQIEKERSQKEELQYPSCNMSWSADEGTKVWCTKSSGGVTRNWIGVPRQLFTPGIENPRCVCVNMKEENTASSLLKTYDNCPSTSTTCYIK